MLQPSKKKKSSSTTDFSAQVYAVVKTIPPSRTLTYKEVARLAGRPNAYRAVGNILNKNTNPKEIPCHRVVRSDGTVGGYAWGSKQKLEKLRQEGAFLIC